MFFDVGLKNTVNYSVFGHLTLKNHGICSGFCFSPRKNTVNNSNFAVFSCFSLFFELRWSAIHGYQILRFFFRQSVLSDVFGLNGRHHWQLRAAAQRCGAGGCRREATWIIWQNLTPSLRLEALKQTHLSFGLSNLTNKKDMVDKFPLSLGQVPIVFQWFLFEITSEFSSMATSNHGWLWPAIVPVHRGSPSHWIGIGQRHIRGPLRGLIHLSLDEQRGHWNPWSALQLWILRKHGKTFRQNSNVNVKSFLWIFNYFQRYVGNSTQKRGLNKPKGLGRQKYERPGHWLKEGTTLEKGLCLGAYLSLYLHQDTLMGWTKNESSYTLTTLPIAFGWGSLCK